MGQPVTAAAAIQPGFERMLHSLTCPHCQAAPGSPCITTSGRKAYLHQKRVEASLRLETRRHAVCRLLGSAPAGLSAGDEVLTLYIQLDRHRAGRKIYARIGDGIRPGPWAGIGKDTANTAFVRWATPADLLALPGDAPQQPTES